MIQRKYEVKNHTVTERVCTEAHMICDICKKTEITGHHWSVHTFHSDWGNDSIDSHEYFDVCSIECLQQKLDEYVKESNNGYNTQEIIVEHKKGVYIPDVIKQ